MKQIFTTSKNPGLKTFLAFLLGMFFSFSGSYAQIVPIYADQVSMNAHVSNSGNAVDATDLTNFATLNSYGGLLLGGGAYSGEIELQFPTALPAETTSYVKIDFDPAVLDALLGGNLGDGLAGLLGSVVLGDHYFNVEARLGSVPVLSDTSEDELTSDRLKLVVNANGDYLLAITPNSSYDRIYIEDVTDALLLGTSNSMDVYYAYYITGQDFCDPAFATSFDGSGGTVSALGLGNAGVTNPENAIDGNSATFSELSQGLLSVAGSLSQTVYFQSLSGPTDQYHITIRTDEPALLNLGLLDGVKIEALEGSTVVSTVALSSLLDLDLLGLLNNAQKATISFSPGVSFDRIRVSISSLVQLNLVKSLEIYEVYRSPAPPTVPVDSQNIAICVGETAVLSATTANGNGLVWYADQFGGTSLAVTGPTGTYTTSTLTADTTFYVSARRSDCPQQESSRVAINVTVHPVPGAPVVVDNAIEVNSGGTAMMEVQNPGAHITYKWYDAATGGNLLQTGDIYIVSNITAPVNYYVEATVGDNCISSSRTQVAITITNNLLPPTVTPPVLTITEGQSGTYTASTDNPDPNLEIVWYDQNGNQVHVGTTYSTPNTLLVGTYTYDVVVHDPVTGNDSPPTTVTLNIVSAGVVANCTIANAQANGINPVCLACSVENPLNATDGDPTTYSRFVAPAALLGGGVYQELIFPTPGIAGDTISIKIGTGSSLLDVNLLQEVSFESYNGTTANADGGAVGGLVNLDLLPGTNLGEISFVAGANFDRVRIAYSPLVGLLDSGLRIYQANINFPNPVLVTTDLAICVGETAMLEVTPIAGTTIHWYDVETGGTALATGNTYTTPVQNTAGKITYYAAIERNSCEDDERFPVHVNVYDIPAAPLVVDNNIEVNSGGTATLEVVAPENYIAYKWYDAPAGGNLLFTGPVYVVPNITSPLVYYVEATVGDNCTSTSRTMVTITITNALLPPNVAPPVLVVTEGESGTFTASTDNPDPNLEIQWYDQNGNLVFTGTVYQTPDTLPVGTYTYDVVLHDPVSGNTSAPTTVTLIVVAPNPVVNCTIANAQTNGTNFLCVACGVENPENAVDGDPTTYSRFVAPAAALGGGVYQELIFPTAGVAGDTITIKIGTGNSLLDLNLLQEISFESYNGTTANGDGTSAGGLLNLDLLPGTNIGEISFVAGAAFDRVKIEYSPLVGLLDSGLRIYQADINYPNPNLVTTNVAICVGETAMLEVTSASGTTVHWYDVETGGTALASGNTYTTPVQNTAGEIIYYVGIERNGCEDDARFPVSVNVYNVPASPVVVDNSIVVNSGGNATLEVQDPEPHITYKWYDAATGGSLVHTGDVYIVQNIITPANYYVEASIGDSCSSPSRAQVAITITNNLLPPTVVPPVLTITVGESGTFTASANNPDPNLEIQWYDQNGILVYTGTVYNTPNTLPIGTYTYDVYVHDPVSGNTSAPTTVTLIIVPPNTVTDCTEANAQANGTNLICVLCGVENPDNAVDGNPNTYSRFVAPAALLGGGVYQELIFQQAGVAGDTITVKIGTGNSLLDVNLLQEITVESYNGSTANGDGGVVDGALIDLQLLPGVNTGEISFVAGANFDRVRIQYSPLVGLLDSGLRVYEADISFPGPGNLTTNVEVCVGDTATLSATPAAGTTLHWYDAATGGNLLLTGNSYTTPALTTEGIVTYYLAISRNGCEDPDRIPVDIQVNDPDTPTSNDLTQEFCAADMPTLADIQVNEPDVTWYDAATGGTVLADTTTLVDGTIYYASLGNPAMGCESSVRLAITVSVGDAATPTATDATQDFCIVDSPTVADIEVNETGVIFYDAATGGNIVSSTTALVDGTTYYASLTDSTTGCESSVRLAIAVTIGDGITPTTNDTSQDFCAADMPTVADIQVNETDVIFYDAATGGNILSPTTALVDGTSYYVSSGGSGNACESIVRLEITVNINDAAIPTTLDNTQSFCASDVPTVSDIQVNEPNVTWYDVATGGIAFADTDPLVDGTTYYATLTNPVNGCKSSVRLAVTVNIDDAATPTTTDTTQDFCAVDMPSVANIQVNESGVIFYDAATGGNSILPGTPLIDGMIYYASLTDPTSGCESSARLAITVSVGDSATPTTTDPFQDFCAADTPTVADIQVNETDVTFYDALTGGNVVAPATALVDGASYFASLGDPGSSCESSVRLAIVVNIHDATTPTTTNTTQDFCASDMPTVADIQVNETNITWYDAATGGTVVANTDLLVNGTTYYASLTDPLNGCESSVRLAVTVNIGDAGTPTTTNTTQDFCAVDMPTIADIQINETGVVFYDAATGGNIVSPTTALIDGTIYYASLTDPASGCESSARLAITVSVGDSATPTSNDTTQDFCAADMPTIADIQVNETGVTFYDALTGGNVVAPATALVDGASYFASLGDPGSDCESSVRLEIIVNIDDAATPTTTNTTQDFCASDMPTVTDIQVNETNITWYDAATGGTVVANTDPLVDGTIYYATLTNSVSGCESSVRLAVTVNVDDAATPTTLDTTQEFCLIDAPTVADIQINETGIVFYDAATGGNVISPTTALIDGTIYYASLTDPATGCESSVRLAITVSVGDSATPTSNDTTQDFCAVDMPTVADIQVNETGVTFYDALTGGNVVAPATALVDGASYFASLGDPGSGCESSIRLEIIVNIDDAATPTATNTTQDFCASDMPTVADIQVNETNITWYDAATGGAVVSNTTALTDGSVYYASLTDPTSGCESAVRLAITVNLVDVPTPTTNDTTQDFCAANSPIVADIQVNEPNVVWYDAATGGAVVPNSTALVNGTTYYAVIVDPVTGCESSTRLAITVGLNNGGTPTTNNATQDFCVSDAPTVADIQVNESNVIWYDAATGGSQLAGSTPLTDGTTYYAGFDPASGCPTTNRLSVTVNIDDAPSPTTNDAIQEFCANAAPTVADIQVNEPNITWYDVPSGGTALASTTPLVDGTTYYATLTDPATGCESSVRLAVTITLSQGQNAAITGPDTNVCAFENVTYTTNPGMTNYVWTVTGGTIVSGGSTSDDFVDVSWTSVGGSNSVSVTFTDPSGCTANTTATVNVSVVNCADLTITKEVDNPTPMVRENVTFTIKVTNEGNTVFSNIVVTDQLPSGYEYVSSMVSHGTYNSISGIWGISSLNANETATMEIVATVLGQGDYLNVVTIDDSVPLDSDLNNNRAEASVDPICLTVYNEFSPNNDGSNDLFIIDCIESYPDNELKIYNRYGSLIYQTQSYENNWNGVANTGTFSTDEVPEATYFYVLELKSEGKVLQGWLYLTR